MGCPAVSRSAAVLALAAAGLVVFAGRGARAATFALPEADGASDDELPQPPPDAPPVPVASYAPGQRVAPSYLVSILPEVDPERWMPVAELLAFVEIESAFQPRAYRFEPRLNEASYGLMQVLESTGRQNGLGSAPPEAMYDPATSLRIGIAYSRWCWDYLTRRLNRDPTENEWVGSYNAGVGNVMGGRIPLSYVQKWRLARDRYAGA